MGVLQQVVVVLDRPGRSPLELTPIEKSMRWTSLAVGGFGELSFSVAGDRRREMDRLSIARVMVGPKVLHEARVEDRGLSITPGEVSTTVRCFGRRRIFDDVSLRAIWTKRDLQFAEYHIPATATKGIEVAMGRFDATDLSKYGVTVKGTGNGDISPVLAKNAARADLPKGSTGITLLVKKTVTIITGGGNLSSYTAAFLNGAAVTVPGAIVDGIELKFVMTFDSIVLGATNTAAVAYVSDDHVDAYDIRVLGRTTSEDVRGGFYGSTLLRDLLTFCPDLAPGIIEIGDDFVLQQADYSTRAQASKILQDVTGFYAREWGVWEDGRFDWRTPQLEQEQWVCTISDLAALDLTESIDDVTKTTFLSFVNAGSGLNDETSAAATDPRNPFVKTGTTRDQVVSPGFPMTSASAAQLAAKLVKDAGGYVPVRGRVTIPVDRIISNVIVDDPTPALYIRGGENIRIADLPTTDPYGSGRDGETQFHIVSAEIDTEAGLITLDLEGLTRRQDVILARLAAATRTITG